MIYVFYLIHIVVSLFLILVVLLQQGKGADLSVFGGGASQAAFGARGAATLLHKLTVVCFVLFILTTLSIGVVQSRSSPSVMRDVPAAADQDVQPGAASEDETAPDSAETEAQAAEAEAESEDPATSPEASAETGSGEATEPDPN